MQSSKNLDRPMQADAAVICDVSDAASAEAAIAKAEAVHGPARVLVNCAGIGVAKRVIGKEGPMALGDFDRVIRVNLIGCFNMLRLATAGMSKLEPLATGERGVVISTASVAAYDGQIGQSAYSASKGGIFFSSRRRHTKFDCDWSSDVWSSD